MGSSPLHPHTQGGQELDHSTCGWLFSLESLAPVLDGNGHELVVELDLTVFPNELEVLGDQGARGWSPGY